jgi:hypothetical protein
MHVAKKGRRDALRVRFLFVAVLTILGFLRLSGPDRLWAQGFVAESSP